MFLHVLFNTCKKSISKMLPILDNCELETFIADRVLLMNSSVIILHSRNQSKGCLMCRTLSNFEFILDSNQYISTMYIFSLQLNMKFNGIILLRSRSPIVSLLIAEDMKNREMSLYKYSHNLALIIIISNEDIIIINAN